MIVCLCVCFCVCVFVCVCLSVCVRAFSPTSAHFTCLCRVHWGWSRLSMPVQVTLQSFFQLFTFFHFFTCVRANKHTHTRTHKQAHTHSNTQPSSPPPSLIWTPRSIPPPSPPLSFFPFNRHRISPCFTHASILNASADHHLQRIFRPKLCKTLVLVPPFRTPPVTSSRCKPQVSPRVMRVTCDVFDVNHEALCRPSTTMQNI